MIHVKTFNSYINEAKVNASMKKSDVFLNNLQKKYPEHYAEVAKIFAVTNAKSGEEAAEKAALKKLGELTDNPNVSLTKGRTSKEGVSTRSKMHSKQRIEAYKAKRIGGRWEPVFIDLEDFLPRATMFKKKAQEVLDKAVESGDKKWIIRSKAGLRALDFIFTDEIFDRLNDAALEVALRYNTQFLDNKNDPHIMDRLDPYRGNQIIFNDSENKEDKYGVIFQNRTSYAASRTLLEPGARIERAFKNESFGGLSVMMYASGVACGRKVHVKELEALMKQAFPDGIDEEDEKELKDNK